MPRVRLITHGGRTQTLAEWAREAGLKPGTVTRRLNKLGWSIQRALSEPATVGRRSCEFETGRPCSGCGEELVPREDEPPGDFNRRLSCDSSCGSRAARKKILASRSKTFTCKECRKRTKRTNFVQHYCLRGECVRVRKRRINREYARRKRATAPKPCELCERELPRDRRRYHRECFRQKERERSAIIYARKCRLENRPIPVGSGARAVKNAKEFWPEPAVSADAR
jgi:hypothetical protein